MKLTTFFSLLSAMLSIAVSSYTIYQFMGYKEDEKKNTQEVNEVVNESENTAENDVNHQKLNEDDQDIIHQNIYQYIKESKNEEKKKEKSRSRMALLLMKFFSLLISYLVVALVIAFFIKNKTEYIEKIVKKELIPTEIKNFSKKICRQKNIFEKTIFKIEELTPPTKKISKEKISLCEKGVLFKLGSNISQPFFIEMIFFISGFYLFADFLEESLISFLFAFFKDRKKNFFRRWKEVAFSLKESTFDQIPIFRTISQVLIYFINILWLYFMFRMVVYGVYMYNNKKGGHVVGGGTT